MRTASVYYGDCLKHLTHWNNWNQWREVGREEAVRRMLTDRKLADLIYLDPPWNSNEDYNVTYETTANKELGFTAQTTAFTDIWEWGDAAAERLKRLTKDYFSQNDPFYPLAAERLRECIAGLELVLRRSGMLAYITYMAERLAFCRELLKETGSIYLHCDPTASHSLKLVMDAIFGEKNFRNQIVWKRTTSDQKGSHHKPKSWGNNTDIIFFYVKSDKNKLNPFRPLTPEEIEAKFNKTDEKGVKYQDDSAHIFRNPSLGEMPSLCYKWRGFFPPGPWGWRLSKKRLEEEYQRGRIVIKENGKLERRRYLEDHPGIQPGNLWTDIPPAMGKDKRPYKTGKPLKLLKRIIKASTNEGDIVLDPFCGCGTTMVAAHQLKRQFVGIDLSLFVVQSVVRNWLEEVQIKNIRIAGIPEDLASARQLAIDDPFAFETFAIELCHPAFVANKEQRGDGGTDGRGFLLQPVKEKGKWKHEVLVQVKGGKNGPSIEKVKGFARDIERSKTAICGVFITVEQKHWGSGMKKIAREMGRFEHPDGRKYPRLQHWYLKRADLRAREETMLDGLPNLPALLGLNKKALIPKQADFSYWKHTEEEN